VPGQMYWKDAFLPAGVCAVITPMNFIYGIPCIQIVACFLSGSPFVFKGHPFAAITNTTLIKMLLAAGADPRAVHKVEGFGREVAALPADPRVVIVSVTGSAETAKAIQRARGVRPVRFEGGGCNWAWIDDGYSDGDLAKIAARLAYAKLGLGSHKCTTLHGIAASAATLDRIEPMIVAEMKTWQMVDPRGDAGTKIVSPVMVHKASTVTSIQTAAMAAGVRILLAGGKIEGTDYADNAEVASPVVLSRVTPSLRLKVDWDGTEKWIFPALTEFFMPILVTMQTERLDEFLHFCLNDNPHDLATSLWTRDDAKLWRGRRTLAGMLKENDGTDSALEWEEFGASGVGESGNTGVGDAETTIGMFCRRQKGRHLIF
jgi:acyl-CoA reductase-like NAD-dependent aldehyde dehydrogenase